MKVAVRPFDHSEELQRGVDRLRKLIYPHLPESTDVAWHASIWRWLESHPLGNEMQRWVLVTEEEEVVGHLAATPQYYRIGGERVVAYTPADYQVLPKYGFQALLLMRKFFRSTENCVAVDMLPSVIAVETRLGAEAAGGMQYVAKLLNVSRLPSPRLPSPVRRLLNIREQPEESAPVHEEDPAIGIDDVHEHVLPPPKRPRAPIPAPVKGLLNGGLQVVDEALSRGFGDRSRVEVLEGFDESFDELFEKIAAQVPCVPEKDSAFLRWRYGPGSPQTPVTILGVREGEDLLGYAVLGVTVENLEGFRDAYILDLVALPGRLYTRPRGAPGTPRRSTGAARGGGALLQEGRGAPRQVPVPRVAHLSQVGRPVALRFLPPQGEAQLAAGEVRGLGEARGSPPHHQLVVQHR
jgi:hypothetical protein